MEELQKQVREILDYTLDKDNETNQIADALDKCELTNHDIAQLIVNAYDQGVDKYFMGYIKNDNILNKVKERLLNDFIK